MNIAIVGAGEGGTKIIRTLSDMPEVKIVMVIDRNFDAPGIILAQVSGIKCADSLTAIKEAAPSYFFV